jgi:hypothetical protein
LLAKTFLNRIFIVHQSFFFCLTIFIEFIVHQFVLTFILEQKHGEETKNSNGAKKEIFPSSI